MNFLKKTKQQTNGRKGNGETSTKKMAFSDGPPEATPPLQKCPIVYCPEYNINPAPIPLFLLQRLHPFDAQKWGNVHGILRKSGKLSADAWHVPSEASNELLMSVHTEQYLRSLRNLDVLSAVLEVPLNLPILNRVLGAQWADNHILRPMRLQTGGTVLAAELALEHGWAINIGGGFHHASADRGEGFCVYADISVALKQLLLNGRIRRAMIVDLDAHQGNGHERDMRGNPDVYIMDMFNAEIFPDDRPAYEAIRKAIPLRSQTGDDEYLAKLSTGLEEALAEFPRCDLLLYNAGTDPLKVDQLGQLAITEQGIVARDQLVFELARQQHKVPVVMVTSGGYSPASARVIAKSILNLHDHGLIQLC